MILDLPFPPDMRVENEALSLVAAGHQVFLLSFSFNRTQPSTENYKGIQIQRIFVTQKWKKRGRALINTWLDWYSGFMSRKIETFISQNEIQVIHAHDLYMLKAAFRANKKFQLPVIADLHENYVEALKSYTFANRFPGKFLISQRKWAESEIRWGKQADQIITVIEEAVPRYVNLGIPKSKITVVPNYVNPEEFSYNSASPSLPGHLSAGFLALYIGSFEVHRGLESVIRAVPEIVSHIPDFKLILVGEGPNRSILQQMSIDLGIAGHVFFEGFQPPTALPAYIKSAQVGLIPHLKNVHTDHTIPHKLFHYMLFELPVLSSDCAPLQRIINETRAGLIFRNNDPKDFARKMVELFQSPDLRKQMGKAGAAAVQAKYNWRQAGENLVQLYNHVASVPRYRVKSQTGERAD